MSSLAHLQHDTPTRKVSDPSHPTHAIAMFRVRTNPMSLVLGFRPNFKPSEHEQLLDSSMNGAHILYFTRLFRSIEDQLTRPMYTPEVRAGSSRRGNSFADFLSVRRSAMAYFNNGSRQLVVDDYRVYKPPNFTVTITFCDSFENPSFL
jgi:hypothetical protein